MPNSYFHTFNLYSIIWALFLLCCACHKPSDSTETAANDNSGEHIEILNHFEYVGYSDVKLHKRSRASRNFAKRAVIPEEFDGYIDSEDSFLLELYGYNMTFCIHLHPNYELFHENIKKRAKNTVNPYRGYVVAARNDSDPFEMQKAYVCDWQSENVAHENYAPYQDNWARLTVHNKLESKFKSMDHRPSIMKPLVESIQEILPSYRSKSNSGLLRKGVKYIPIYEGVFIYNSQIFSVKTIDSYKSSRGFTDKEIEPIEQRHPHHYHAQMIIHRKDDVQFGREGEEKDDNYSFCGSQHTDWNKNEADKYFESVMNVYKQSLSSGDASVVSDIEYRIKHHKEVELSKRSSIPVKQGCPLAKKVLYTEAVMDCTYIQRYGNVETAQNNVITAWNSVSAIYERTYNIYIGLLEITPLPTCETDLSKATKFNRECSSSYTINQRLNDFSFWRGDASGMKLSDAGLFHLMSNCSTGSTIGIAWINMVCTTDVYEQKKNGAPSDYVSGTGVTTVSKYEFMTVSHEMGHNFGAIHDCTTSNCENCGYSSSCPNCCPCSDCDCQNGFIMNPTSNVDYAGTPKFSDCSQNMICGKYQIFGQCLEDPGSRVVFNKGICGNGIREGDEECDCGSNCAQDTCCYQNCTLKAGALCSDSNDGCCRNCHVIPKSENYVCRPANGICDISESCSGEKTCPQDLYKDDGLVCGDKLTCASGLCTNKLEQCKAYRTDAIGECTGLSGQCLMFCNTKDDGCVKMSGYFLDGSPCGTNGLCKNRKCTNPNIVGQILDWIMANQNIAIAIILIVCIILLILGNKCLKVINPQKDVALIREARLQERELEHLEEIENMRKAKDRKAKMMKERRQSMAADGEIPPAD